MTIKENVYYHRAQYNSLNEHALTHKQAHIHRTLQTGHVKLKDWCCLFVPPHVTPSLSPELLAGSHSSKVPLLYQPFRPQSTWKHPIPRMLSVQMGRASDTCSIKGIRGDLTTSLSASWPHIDQPVWVHSQSVWQLNLGPAHSQVLSFTHTHTHTHTRTHTQIHILNLLQTDVDVLCILSRWEHVYLLVSSQLEKSKGKKEAVLGDWICFTYCRLSRCKNKWLSFFQLPDETCRNLIPRIDFKAQILRTGSVTTCGTRIGAPLALYMFILQEWWFTQSWKQNCLTCWYNESWSDFQTKMVSNTRVV